MKMRHSLLIAGLLATIAAVPAIADLNYTEGDGVTRNKLLFDFICFTTKHCSAHVPVNSAGTEIATSSNPLRTDPTGTTPQPVSGSVTANLGTIAGVSTAATQGTTADAPCTLPATTAACTEQATLKAIANAANSPASLAVNVTPTDCSATVVTGGTAVNAFTAQTTLHGFTILNDDTSEVMWISFTATAAASTAGSYPLAPATATSFAGASSFTSPPGFGTNHALSVVAATTGHKFSCTWW